MKQIQLTNEKQHQEGVRKHTVNRVMHIGPVSLRVLTIASLSSLLLLYLAQTTQGATKSYEVQSLQATQEELVEDVERLELEAQRLQSLGEIQRGLGDRVNEEFEPVGDIEAIEPTADQPSA